MFVYCLYISGSMAGDEIHNANDDCAICKAWSKKQAIKKFKRMYCDFEESDVFPCRAFATQSEFSKNKLAINALFSCLNKCFYIFGISKKEVVRRRANVPTG